MVRKPSTWKRGPQLFERVDRGLPYLHVGASLSELEYRRYRERPILDSLLAQFDILQFVAGAAPWLAVAERVDRPKCLWVATTIAADRASLSAGRPSLRKAWSGVMTRFALKYEERALRIADSILALSPYTVRSLAPMLGGREVPIAVCGVDTSVFYPAAEGNGERYILCVARLFDPRKNVAMLLGAYAELVHQRDDVPDLVLVGEPLSTQGFRLLTSLGIADKVRCIGPTHGEDLADTYRGASMFVLSSDEEGLGIVILEAMASGLPVVSTASGGPEAAVTDGVTGFLTPVGDQGALRSAMEKLIYDQDLRKKFGAAGRRAVEEKFSIAATGEVFLKQYERITPAR